MTLTAPTRRLERGLLRAGHAVVAGVDEVGRGALAGPVSVGVVLVDARTRTAPRGLQDSKLLTPAARQALRRPVRRWAVAAAVGHASACEIDAVGIVAALRTAAHRALDELAAAGHRPSAVILDGTHDWLSQPAQASLFDAVPGGGLGAPDRPAAPATRGVRDGPAGPAGPDGPAVPAGPDGPSAPSPPVVHLQVKADRTCAVVAAASVLAKCERDDRMVDLGRRYPGYGWVENKGYAVPEHLAALRAMGPSPLHRLSWRLPLVEPAAGVCGEERQGGMMGE